MERRLGANLTSPSEGSVLGWVEHGLWDGEGNGPQQEGTTVPRSESQTPASGAGLYLHPQERPQGQSGGPVGTLQAQVLEAPAPGPHPRAQLDLEGDLGSSR